MFQFTCVDVLEAEPFGYIRLSSNVYFHLPEDTTPDDIGFEQGFSLSFTKYTDADKFVLDGINNIYWNDSFMIPPQVLTYIEKHYETLLTQAESVYAANNANAADTQGASKSVVHQA